MDNESIKTINSISPAFVKAPPTSPVTLDLFA
jgi:hypothetical protein